MTGPGAGRASSFVGAPREQVRARIARPNGRVVARLALGAVCIALGLAGAPRLSTAQAPARASAREVVVELRGLRGTRGIVVGSLFTSAARWLREGEASGECRTRVAFGAARCVFVVEGASSVAFAGYHDEDQDGVFDRDALGLPREGYAFSNDEHEPFGPPSFAAAAFAPVAGRAFVVRVRYGL